MRTLSYGLLIEMTWICFACVKKDVCLTFLIAIAKYIYIYIYMMTFITIRLMLPLLTADTLHEWAHR